MSESQEKLLSYKEKFTDALNNKADRQNVVLEIIRGNPNFDSVDITNAICASPMITLLIINDLTIDNKIKRVHRSGVSYGYDVIT